MTLDISFICELLIYYNSFVNILKLLGFELGVTLPIRKQERNIYLIQSINHFKNRSYISPILTLYITYFTTK